MTLQHEFITMGAWAFIKFNLLSAAILIDNGGSIQALHAFWGF